MNKNDLIKKGLTKEALEAAGLNESVLDEIIILHGKDIESHKTKIGSLEAELEQVGGKLNEANDKIKSFEKLEPEKLKDEVASWQAKAAEFETQLAEARRAADAEVTKVKYDFELTEELKNKYRVKDPNDIKHLLNHEKITRGENGEFIGLKEQVEPMWESKDYLFNPADDSSDLVESQPRIVKGASPGAMKVSDTVIAAARQAAGVGEDK